MKLICAGREVPTVFDLLGNRENDMTFSLGWGLANSEHFLAALLRDLTGRPWNGVGRSVVKLQTGRAEHGITDVEIDLDSIAIIFEAKRGAELPGAAQLKKYAAVLTKASATERLLVMLTNATPAYATVALARLASEMQGVRLLHRSWREIKAIAESVISRETNANKGWLRSFIAYLEGLLEMETRFSNRTYVVSLGRGNPEGWGISWIDIVEKRKRYFYPVGKGWPDPPPNYIAFRYGGSLRNIHHVEGCDLITDPQTVFPEAAKGTWPLHYCLHLGPPIPLATRVPAGRRIKHAARVWCMIDTLLTSETISDALSETKRRMGSAPPDAT